MTRKPWFWFIKGRLESIFKNCGYLQMGKKKKNLQKIFKKNHVDVTTKCNRKMGNHLDSSSLPEVFLGKHVLKVCSKSTGDNPCRSVISIKLLCNFTEITLRNECSPVDLLYIFRTPFYQNTCGGLLLISLLISTTALSNPTKHQII